MSEAFELEVGVADEDRRLDIVVAEHLPALSRVTVQELVRAGEILVNGRPSRPSRRLASADLISGSFPPPASTLPAAENFPLPIVYRDDDLVVIDKPAGLVVHPAPGHTSGTMANALAALFPEVQVVGQRARPGIVHRLDKNTSGLLVVALTPAAHVSLQRQIAQREAQRVYLALASGTIFPPTGIIDAPIGRDRSDRKRMTVHGIAARPARTIYRVLEEFPGFSLVEARLESGRTHQIRVHLAAAGHPLAGDTVYHGPALAGLARQFLHAHRLTFASPSTGDELAFTSELPPDLEAVLRHLQNP